MSTQAATIAHLLDTLAAAGDLSARKMFGEYGLYLDGRMVALVCDDRLFIRPTPGALAALPAAGRAPPYPGAKDHLAPDDALDDPEPVVAALKAVAREVLPPKKKR